MRFDRNSRAAPASLTAGAAALARTGALAACLLLAAAAGRSTAFAYHASVAAAADRPAANRVQETTQARDEEHRGGVLPIIAKIFNFAALAGMLVYFLRTPLVTYLESRSTQIRQDLVTAQEMRAAAAAQLAEIQKKLASLPGELEALRTQGAQDVAAERVRISQVAAAERERLLQQMHREIEMRLRVARRELLEHAARLAVDVARTRIVRMITPDDQLRILDRYTTQLKEAR